MKVRVQIKELDKLEKFIRVLPKKLDINMSNSNQKFMENLRDLAKNMAPSDTGELVEGIRLEPVRRGKNVKQWKLVSMSPHGLFQEVGFTPHQALILNSSKLAPGSYWVSKFTPHIDPALQSVLTTLDNRLSSAINKSLK